MSHKHVFEAVDKSLRDVLQNENELFGGKVFLLGGDFRQILPVVVRGSREETVNATVKRSYLWSNVICKKLTINMRLKMLEGQDADVQNNFAQYQLRVGDGTETADENDFIKLPEEMCCKSEDVDAFISEIYNDIEFNYDNCEYLVERAILCPKNDNVDKINEKVISMFPGIKRKYLSCDTVVEEGDEGAYPTEFLNSLNVTGMPSHKLELKNGMPIMLLRNLDPKSGLCNGTRLIIKDMQNHILDCEIASGDQIGNRVFIPRIPLISSGIQIPFQFKRKQFPVRPAFAMTINKAQGQTMKLLGIFLPEPVFSHGQLYVAISRVCAPHCLKFLVLNGKKENENGIFTKNIVYKEIY